tara:strand:+ start:4134 stop:4916 length:783 start_codon:yes stop_codon:yes gene_type:complete
MRRSVEAAVRAGQKILDQGGTALDAVHQTVLALEDDPTFDAGTGGFLNRDGEVQLDALIIDGASVDFGAIAGVRRMKNPITLARAVMEQTEQVMFVGEDADRMARTLGIDWVENETLVIPAMRNFFEAQKTDGPNDTVGAIALDKHGNFAAATSTSGTPFKPAGRVGDSPFFGAGGYAENGVGASGATGQGEQIMRTLLSKFLCDRMYDGMTAQAAADAATAHFDKRFPNSMSGVIANKTEGLIDSVNPVWTCCGLMPLL